MARFFLYLILLTICLASCQSGRNVSQLPQTPDQKADKLMAGIESGVFRTYNDRDAVKITAPLYSGCKTIVVQSTGLTAAQADFAQEYRKEDCVELPCIYWACYVYAYDDESDDWILLPALIYKTENNDPYEATRKFTKRKIRCNPNGEEISILVQD